MSEKVLPGNDIDLVHAARAVCARKNITKLFQQPDPPIIVYQMGKVGSTSVLKMLQNAGQHERCIQLHMLSERLDRSKTLHQKKGKPYPLHLHESEYVTKNLAKFPDRLINIIALVRDPIARQVSNIFQNPTPEL
jgi:hypothetical protein